MQLCIVRKLSGDSGTENGNATCRKKLEVGPETSIPGITNWKCIFKIMHGF